MIQIQGLTHRYGPDDVLHNINLTLQTGDTLVLMGPNGAGKSTLLSIVAGLITPSRGRILINGHTRRRSIEEETACRRAVFYMSPTVSTNGYFTVEEWLLEISAVYGVPAQHAEPHVANLLSVFDLQAVAHHATNDISTGQNAKLRLCGALVSEAPVLILDEPFSGGMDPAGLLAARTIIERLAASRTRTILLASPVPEDIEHLNARIALLVEGVIREEDTIHGLTHRTDPPTTLAQAYSQVMNPDLSVRTTEYLDRYGKDPATRD